MRSVALSPRSAVGIPTLAQIQAERARRIAALEQGGLVSAVTRSLATFVRLVWPTVEPATPLVWNWHLDIICRELELQALGDMSRRKLLFCVPPGSMKSLLVSVFEPAWEWLQWPERRKLFLTNDDDLGVRDSRRTREIITSLWYQDIAATIARERGQEPWRLAHDQNEKVNFANTRHGFRQCRSLGSKITGKRADDIIIDDPLDAKEVINGSLDQISKRLEECANVVEKVLPSRVNNLARARWTTIMQRLHPNDTAGRAIREGGWRVINIQMEFDPDNPLNHPDDPRQERGELMFPELFPRVELDSLKTVKLGSRHYSAQYNQNPRPGDGGPLKRWYWRFWYPHHASPPAPVRVQMPDGSYQVCGQEPLPEVLFGHTQSWDCAFKDTKDAAYVVGQLWAERGADSYLLDQIRDKMDIVRTMDAIKMMTAAWPQSLAKLIEDKANGPAVIQLLHREIPGLLEVDPRGGKEARANAAAPACRAGNVWLPHPTLFPWANEFLDETEAFPVGQYSDQVDAATQYLNHRYGTGSSIVQQLSRW